MLKVFQLDVYALLDPGATLSFVTPYVVMRFELFPNVLLEPFSASTPVGDFVVAKRVYRMCPVSLYHRVTLIDLVEDVINPKLYRFLESNPSPYINPQKYNHASITFSLEQRKNFALIRMSLEYDNFSSYKLRYYSYLKDDTREISLEYVRQSLS